MTFEVRWQDACDKCIKADRSTGIRGFKHFGKITPRTAQHELYRAVIMSLYLEIISGDSPPYCTLFNTLSPHQRVQSLADIAAGLLCRDTPLPPDTDAHHAALFAVHDHIHEILQMETDDQQVAGAGFDDPAGYYRFDDHFGPTATGRKREFTTAPRPKPPRACSSASRARGGEPTHEVSKALRNLELKRAGKKRSDKELLQALECHDRAKKSWHAQALSPEEGLRHLAEEHHGIFAWPGERYWCNHTRQRRPPAKVFWRMPWWKANVGGFAIRGLLLAVLREFHAGTKAAAEGCEVRLDVIEGTLGTWTDVMTILGLWDAPALNLESSQVELLRCAHTLHNTT